MDEQRPQTHWQSLGSTLNQEFRYVTHLDPHGRPTEAGRGHEQQLNRGYSTRSSRSKDVPTVHRHKSMRLTTRLKRFVHRLTWQKRSKSYLFGKQYLQRQPSFVMTPDRSSFTYRFRSRDLVKSRPHPRYDRSSQPIAAWKHANPMDVLLNKGQVSIPQPNDEGVVEPQQAPQDPLVSEVESPMRGATAFTDGTREESDPSNKFDNVSATAPQTWKKVSLPVKQDRTSGSSQERSDTHVGDQSTPLNSADQSGSGSASKSGSQPKSRSHISYGSPSVLDLPPTPLETRRPPPKAVDLPSKNILFPADSEMVAPRSPTSARSKYRPESWRRSAIVSRNDHIAEPDQSDLDLAIEFVGAWGTYLKRAIAIRAVAERKRKSWELQTERRWSSNLPYNSDFGSSFDSSSSSATRSEDYDVKSSDETNDSSSTEPKIDSTLDNTASATSLEDSTSTASQSHSHSRSQRMDDPALWNSDVGDISTEEFLPDASSESSSVVSQTAMNEPSTASNSEPRLSSSASIQYTPEAITTSEPSAAISPLRSQTSVYPQSPKKSSSSLAPPNSPRALAAMARTSAERKRFSDSLEAAEKRYSVLFTQDSGLFSPVSAAKTVVPSEIGGLNEMSQWQAEESDKETSEPSRPSSNEDGTKVSALRVNKSQTKLDDLLSLQMQPDDFDFTDIRVSRKRPLPVSPVATPLGSRVDLQLNHGNDKPELHKRHSSLSVASLTEDAPSLLKSQSVLKHRLESSHKRVKSSVSRENLLLMRQNTLHSQWAEEESDTDASENFESNATRA